MGFSAAFWASNTAGHNKAVKTEYIFKDCLIFLKKSCRLTQGLKLIGRQNSHKADTNCLYKLPLCIVRLTFGFNMEEFCAAMGRGGDIQ